MAKRKKKQQTKHHSSRSGNRKITNRVLAALYISKGALSINDIVKNLTLPRSGKSSVEEALSDLSRDGVVRKSGKKLFALSKKHPLTEATIEKNPRGFGFATNLSGGSKREVLQKDPFISASRMGSAHHGDRVLLVITKVRRDGRPEAEVIHILERTIKQLAGFYLSDGKHGIVYPEDPRFPFDIVLNSRPETSLNDGDAVIVRLLGGKKDGAPPRGKIIEVLGNPDNIEVQVRLVAAKYGLPNRFSSQAEKEAQKSAPSPGIEEREDLRHIAHITIDGKTAKDFDDAVAVEKTRTGYRLYVSIADVDAFVKAGSTLDREAYERGTSVYFPSTVIPMLPENLSNNLCSLLPDTDRMTVTTVLDFDRQGILKNKRFTRSVIRSRQRFTYDTVKQIIIDKDPAVRRMYKPFLTPLKWAAELAEILQAGRQQRGAIGFTIPEADIQLDDDGQVQSINKVERHFAHQIIEEFMLAANEAVANIFTERKRPMLFRIHEKPNPDKLKDFVRFSATLGLELPKDMETSAWYNNVIENVQNTPKEYIINNLLLRTMQQAQYSPDNIGHFGLASEDYTHFTSPIRRYPDLIVHRLLCQLISEVDQKTSNRIKISPSPSLKEDGRYLSERERLAVSSERDMADRLKRQFMANRIGESFKAVISGVSDSIFFVELLDIFVRGAVALSTLTDDFYLLDENNYRLIGDVSCRILQIGDVVDVVLLDVDQYQNRVNFTLRQKET